MSGSKLKPWLERFLVEEYQCANSDQDFLKCWSLIELAASYRADDKDIADYQGPVSFDIQELMDFLHEAQNDEQAYIEGPSFTLSSQEGVDFDIYSGELHVQFITDRFICPPEAMLKELERVIVAYHSKYPD